MQANLYVRPPIQHTKRYPVEALQFEPLVNINLL